MNRLPPQAGEWIDRDCSVSFRFEGQTYQGFRGDVVTSALWASGVRMVGRSFKYHRPRGTMSMSGYDTAAMLDDGARTNLRGDVLAIEDGMQLKSVNTWGGVRNDWLRLSQWAAKMMPVGFYYKAFYSPRWLFPHYEKMLRRIAGLGNIRADSRTEPSPKDYAWHDVLVIGSGPSGLSAALSAADCGCDVLLVDEHPRLGGSALWQSPQEGGEIADLIARVESHPSITIRTSTQVAGCYDDKWIALVDAVRLSKLRAKAVVVASGAHEQPAVFGNNDLPGVLLASAAQRLIHLYAVKPCERCVVLTANGDGYRAAIDLAEAGVEVEAVLDMRHDPSETNLVQQIAGMGITVKPGHVITEAIPSYGGVGVAGARTGRIAIDGTIEPSSEQYSCDGIVLSTGWAPAAAPLYQFKAAMEYRSDVEQFVPARLPEGVFAAGRVNGVFERSARLADGVRAGLSAAQHLGKHTGQLPNAPQHHGDSPSHNYPVVHKAKKNFIDLDEDVHVADMVNAHAEGFDNIELMKRYTTVGMGPSQGKTANMNSVRILARLNNASVQATGTTTSRPFYHPVPIAHLAGRRFHPVRRTPMHSWHLAAGAEMVHVGSWLRPEYYANAGESREATILSEAKHIRSRVGLIDLGTLGKIEIVGPDAAELLERIYTNRFASQKLGRLQYALACDESGTVIEDGVVARLADDRYYATTTTGGATSFFRQLQRWAQIWHLDVTLADLTGHFTAMNIAGPLAREVLQPLTDVDLSNDAFGFCTIRQGNVAGAPARLMRVGFVGELAYEIHLAATEGPAVWEALLEAGEAAGIKPFGVEAQRLLRLEKGYPIVSHDTDALTNPYEMGVAWTLENEKPFYVGQRSLQILHQQTLTRQMVAVRFEPADNLPALPEECHLIVERGRAIGRVTSVAHKTTLGYPIGLAFVEPEFATPGTQLEIHVSGKRVRTVVHDGPFYDPDHARQEV